mmetsp:Transcript_6357/g.20255  ORF Transcript_6357/g.20255 Transcript_6357/m.20255 type:complete len:301 (+) Transcript_6357:810-1712(+)
MLSDPDIVARLVRAAECAVEHRQVLDAERVALRDGGPPVGGRREGAKEEVGAVAQREVHVVHLVEVDLGRLLAGLEGRAAERVVCAVVQDGRRAAKEGLVPGVEHHVPPHSVGDSDGGGGKDVAVHLRMPHRLLLADRHQVRVLRLELRHRLLVKDVRLLVRKGAHLLCKVEPEGRDAAEVLGVEDVEAAHLREARQQRLVEEASCKAALGADEVGVLGGDDDASRRAEGEVIDGRAEHHVRVRHEHKLVLSVRQRRSLRKPRHDGVRLVVRGVPLLVDERIVPHIAVNKGVRRESEVRL